MITRMSSVMTQFTWFGSALAGKPALFNASLYCASFQPLSSVEPTFVTIVSALPAGSSVDVNDMPCLVRKSFALSQSLNLDHGPTNRWKWHSFAATLIGVFALAASSAGFT